MKKNKPSSEGRTKSRTGKKTSLNGVGSKKTSATKRQDNNYTISADNVRAAIEEFMRTRSLLLPGEIVDTRFPSIEIKIIKEVSD